MIAAAVTMTAEQAQQFRRDYDAKARVLTRMARRDLPSAGNFEGQYSKDELIRRVMDLDGYTIARLNQAIHVLWHKPGENWSACNWCHPHGGNECECDLRRAS